MAERIADIDRARGAIGREAWAEAYEGFRTFDPSRLTPQDLESLANAAWWLSRTDESIAARQKAYAGYAAAGEDRPAAFAAGLLSMEHFSLSSALIGGAGRDAKYIAKHLASRERDGRFTAHVPTGAVMA